MKKHFYNFFLQNLVLKIISLALALLLFFLVRGEKQAMSQGVVRVTYTIPPGQVLASRFPSQLRVAIVGSASRMQRFRFEDLGDVHIDLTHIQEGYFTFSEDLFQLPPGLKVSSIRPSGFRVIYMAMASRRVPVRATIQGEVAEGFEVVRRRVEPTHVRVNGPRDIVMALDEVGTQPISLDGASTTLVQRVDLMALPDRVTAYPSTKLKVTVVVAPATTQVILNNVTVVAAGPEADKVEVSPATVDLTLRGPRLTMARFRSESLTVRVTPVIADGGSPALSPSVEGLPDGVTVQEIRPATVQALPKAP